MSCFGPPFTYPACLEWVIRYVFHFGCDDRLLGDKRSSPLGQGSSGRCLVKWRERMICSITAFTARQLKSRQRKLFPSSRNAVLSRTEILEVTARTAPGAGFPQAFSALAIAEDDLA